MTHDIDTPRPMDEQTNTVQSPLARGYRHAGPVGPVMAFAVVIAVLGCKAHRVIERMRRAVTA